MLSSRKSLSGVHTQNGMVELPTSTMQYSTVKQLSKFGGCLVGILMIVAIVAFLVLFSQFLGG